MPKSTVTVGVRGLVFFTNSWSFLFIVEREEDENFKSFIDRASFLLASYCVLNGRELETVRITAVPSDPMKDFILSKVGPLVNSFKTTTNGIVRLSRREQEVFAYIIELKPNKAIAALLNISERTVKFHVSSILAKYGVENRMALAARARIIQVGEVVTTN